RPRFRDVVLSLAVLAWLALPATPAAAQPQTGAIQGQLNDASGKPVPNFVLRLQRFPQRDLQRNHADPATLQDGRMQTVATATTDANGAFSMTNLKPGDYLLVGGNKSIGFVYHDVSVQPGQTTTVQLTLVKS
ncbi:MAG TPA: carboxypeptidase-like regulatory domain-containing protein, partial [Tepidisphaeraceae bacterium]|nr:carboxypeptidase-like regulatory domain-containing protein [Tepidisphaeraceae bacterium]